MPRAEFRWLLTAVALAALSGCAGKRTAADRDDAPTLKSLASRSIEVAADPGIRSDEAKTIAAYRDFLAAAPQAPQRAEALRRLGDLEMDLADHRAATDDKTAEPDYRSAIARYQDYLRRYPDDAGNDRILYQLARAHEQAGALETALATLERLVAKYPNTAHRDEAHFRRGELLFAMRDYPRAEQAYATVLHSAQDTPYEERALYMQGWSRFKQGRLDEALDSFFGVLDRKLGHADGSPAPELQRAERELVEDTFRVTSLSLQNLQGAETIAVFMTTPERRSYEHRVHEELGALYLKQERVKDAADTYAGFARRHPLHAQAPQLQARVIEIYQAHGFATLALDATKDYVSRYGVTSEFRRANPEGWALAQPLVKTHLTELARHHHAAAQKSKAAADVQEAVRWYRLFLESYPADPQAAANRFLLAELLFEDARYAEAAAEYEKTAYDEPAHAKSADAGYAALLAHARQAKRAADPKAAQRAGVASALRFAAAFPADARRAAVLTDAADQLYALGDAEPAADVAHQVLALEPAASAPQRRVAWTVLAHTAFERGAHAEAERGYAEVLALTPDKEPVRAELVERQAAAIYKQGEQARDSGQGREAVGHFTRIAAVAPQSPVRATAQYDAAAALIGLKDWDAAARTLEDFRQRYPAHPLRAEVGAKLALAYLEQQRWTQAAGEFERLAAAKTSSPAVARDALWQAAALHEKAVAKGAARATAVKAWEAYVKQHPLPLEPALEARSHLAALAKADGNATREAALMKEIFQADQAGGAARTPRTRTLGAQAAIALAAPAAAEYRKVALVEPLARQLKLKKAKFETALKGYAVAAEYGVAEVTTAATHHTAALYQDFGRALLDSQRPRKLSKAEREQYDVLLEEQAYPFEEKAIELHELNARRAAEGVYDRWVAASFKALGTLRPVRYGKAERGQEVIDAIR
jgi:TolA-binding protein